MAEHVYKVGDRFSIGPRSKPDGMVEVISTATDADGKRQVQLEVVELSQDYSGRLQVGEMFSYTEDRFVTAITSKE